MKKTILLVSFLSIFSTLSFAQNIVQEGKEWSYEYNSSGTGKSSGLIYFIQSHFYNDYITYKGLYSSSNKDKSESSLLSLLREENGKVYVCSIDYYYGVNKECLLYDFNVKVGDTIYIPYIIRQKIRIDTLVAVEVSTVVFEGIEQKKVSVALARSPEYILNTWYTGIGDLRGLLYFGNYSGIGLATLICCKDSSGTLLYQNPDYNTCFYSGIETVQEFQAQIKVSPNPVSEVLTFTAEGKPYANVVLQLYTAQGQKGNTQQIQVTPQAEVVVKDLPAGIYYYELLQNQKRIQSGKFVKTNKK